jgi:catechol 2,3-dioxygenase-like lactoylglutathione lyase family enzyme
VTIERLVAAFTGARHPLGIDNGGTEGFAAIGLTDDNKLRPAWIFIKVPDAKTAKNRFHPDLTTADQPADVDRVVAVGASGRAGCSTSSSTEPAAEPEPWDADGLSTPTVALHAAICVLPGQAPRQGGGALRQTPSVATRASSVISTLNVASPVASVHFYELVLGHLGYRQHQVDEGRSRWSLEYADGALFEIEVRPPAARATSERHVRYTPGIDHLAFHADSRSDVDALHQKLVSAGYPVAEPPREYDYAPGYYAVAFEDPSGIRLEVVHDPMTNR